MDEAAKMAAMDAWLDEVCQVLAIDRASIAAVTPQLLSLVGRCAHGPSRPGGPLTAVAVALAASRQADFSAGVDEAIAALQPLFAPYDN